MLGDLECLGKMQLRSLERACIVRCSPFPTESRWGTINIFVSHSHFRRSVGELTDYDRLLRVPGLTREEARIIVSCEVQSILAGWTRKPK